VQQRAANVQNAEHEAFASICQIHFGLKWRRPRLSHISWGRACRNQASRRLEGFEGPNPSPDAAGSASTLNRNLPPLSVFTHLRPVPPFGASEVMVVTGLERLGGE
jgi:hypothetical protein